MQRFIEQIHEMATSRFGFSIKFPLTLIYLGGGGQGKFAPRQFFATAQKRLALDC